MPLKDDVNVSDAEERAQILIKWRNTSLSRIRPTLLTPLPNDASSNMVEDSR